MSARSFAQWKKEAWRDEVKAAARLDLFTIAKLAGTSVSMIERHYGHLQRKHARSALEKLAVA
jgi:hypothetical protein